MLEGTQLQMICLKVWWIYKWVWHYGGYTVPFACRTQTVLAIYWTKVKTSWGLTLIKTNEWWTGGELICFHFEVLTTGVSVMWEGFDISSLHKKLMHQTVSHDTEALRQRNIVCKKKRLDASWVMTFLIIFPTIPNLCFQKKDYIFYIITVNVCKYS